jgi:hypothetical protein
VLNKKKERKKKVLKMLPYFNSKLLAFQNSKERKVQRCDLIFTPNT